MLFPIAVAWRHDGIALKDIIAAGASVPVTSDDFALTVTSPGFTHPESSPASSASGPGQGWPCHKPFAGRADACAIGPASDVIRLTPDQTSGTGH